jgi:indolepyruvate ferredoxin oxidoreductase beta subunit
MKQKDFNLVIVGVGGQGQITLLRILSESALISGYDFKASELHGLSQRGGSVEVQMRFGPKSSKIFSPLVSQAKADFVLALEMHEALRALYYASQNTQFLINDFLSPIPGQGSLSKPEILKEIKKFTKKIKIIEANQICKEKLGKEVLAGIFLISYSSFKNLIPLKPNSILKAIKKIIPEKYLELNLKAFELAKSF